MPEFRHTLKTFADALAQLRENLLMMGSLAERNLNNAAAGLARRDSDLCNRAIIDDEEIDLLEKQIDFSGIEIITRYQPVAGDLRAVVATMRISSNLERVADQATTIARRARKLNQGALLEETILLEPLFVRVTAIFKDSLRACADRDVPLARSLKERDREIDRMNHDIALRLIDAISHHTERVHDYLALIFVARSLERVGDHATNIAEDVVFAEEAEDIRHSQSKLAAE